LKKFKKIIKFTSFKNILASILNLGAIFKFYAWQHWFKKSIKTKKKNGRKCNRNKIRAFQKICKKIRHFVLSTTLNFKKKNNDTKVVFLVKKHSKKVFFLKNFHF
jgi:hypothetical protein